MGKIHTFGLQKRGEKAYDGLIFNGHGRYRAFHRENEFARSKSYVNGIENFWSYAKCGLAKLHGSKEGSFALHLQKSEYEV